MKLQQQSIRARASFEILSQFLESTVRGLQCGCIDLAHGQNEIMTTSQHSSADMRGRLLYPHQESEENTHTQVGFVKKQKQRMNVLF